MTETEMNDTPLWTPSPARIAAATLTRFMCETGQRHGVAFADYAAFYDWSVRESEKFWIALWDFCEVRASTRGNTVLADGDRMPGAKWFPEARLSTPRHVPAKVLQVADIPRTRSGKIVELAVRNVVHAQPVKNVEALANAQALDFFRDRAELR